MPNFNHKIIQAVIISTILLSVTNVIFSDEQTFKILTLDDCIDLAKKNNETVKIQLYKITQAGQKILQASGDVWPDLTFIYQKFYKDTEGNTVTGEGTDSKVYVKQPLFYGLRKLKSIELSRSDKYIAELQLKDITRNLVSDVAKAFYTLAQFDSDLKNIDETLEQMAGREKELIARVNIGKSRESELYMFQSQISVLRSKKQKTSGERKKSVESLSFLIGIETSEINISDNVQEPSGAGPVEKIIEETESRSDIQIANENIKMQEIRVKMAKGGRLPTLDLTSDWYISRSGSSSGNWDLYLLLNLSLFQGGILKAQVNEELSKLQESRKTADLTIREVKTEIHRLHADMESSLEQVSALKKAYEKAKKSYDLQLKDYSVGLVNNLDVIQATLTLLDVKNNLNSAVIQSKLNKVLLNIAVE